MEESTAALGNESRGLSEELSSSLLLEEVALPGILNGNCS